MRAFILFASALAVGQILFACASSSDEPGEPRPSDGQDSGSDAELPPSSEGGPDSASVDADAAAFDAAAPKPLDIVCQAAPCYSAISGSGGKHYCALLADKTVRCWGSDGEGGLREGALGRAAPVSAIEGATAGPVVGLPGPIDRVRVGPNFGTCARTEGGQVYCWGRNDRGQLGAPLSEGHLLTPTRIEGLPPVDEIGLGLGRGCAITTGDRALYCWGTTDFGEYEPVHAMTKFKPPVKALAIGSTAYADTILALLEDDVLAATGANTPVGDSHFPADPVLRSGVYRIAPFAFLTGDGSFRRWLVQEERLYFLMASPIADLRIFGDVIYPERSQPGGAVTANGQLFRWGRNEKGELGISPLALAASGYPIEVQQVRHKVAAFATTTESTCALLVDGKITCWGSNELGELGRGSIDFGMHPEPELIR